MDTITNMEFIAGFCYKNVEKIYNKGKGIL